MKKFILCLMIFTLTGAAVLSAQEMMEPKRTVEIDAGLGLYWGVFDTSAAGDDFKDIAGLFLTLLSLRGGGFIEGRYIISEWISAGAELGLYYMTVTVNGTSYTLIDLPLRVVGRFGYPYLNAEPHVGYLVTIGSTLGGFEAGSKVNLGPVFLDGSVVIGSATWFRIGVGGHLDNIWGF